MIGEIYNFMEHIKDKYDVEIIITVPNENELVHYKYEEFEDLREEV